MGGDAEVAGAASALVTGNRRAGLWSSPGGGQLDPGGDGESRLGMCAVQVETGLLRPGPEAQERVLGISQNLASPQTLRVKAKLPYCWTVLICEALLSLS